MQTQARHIEIHQLDLRYEHTRIYKKRMLDGLYRSLKQFGQLTPVVVTQAENNQLVLIDGYFRVKATRMCGKDRVLGVIENCDEKSAVLSMLRNNSGRAWDAFEEASLLNEFVLRFELGISEAARLIGRDKSFVKRRLDLVRELPEEILDAVTSNAVSIWSATRILVPLARANREHALKLTAYLTQAPLSTRDLNYFFKKYRTSNHGIRSRMIEDPSLFLKVVQNQRQEEEALKLARGVEGRWLKEVVSVCSDLKQLQKTRKKAIYPGLEADMQKKMVAALTEAYNRCNHLYDEVMTHDQTGYERGHQSDA